MLVAAILLGAPQASAQDAPADPPEDAEARPAPETEADPDPTPDPAPDPDPDPTPDPTPDPDPDPDPTPDPIPATAPITTPSLTPDPEPTPEAESEELDEWGLPPVEEEEPEAPPPTYEVRLLYEVLGAATGAIVVGVVGFGAGAASAGADQVEGAARPTDDVLLGGLIGVAIAWPLGAAFGTWLAGEANGGTGDAAGPIVGGLFGAGVGVALGAAVGYMSESLEIGATLGGIVGGLAALAGAVIGYELSSGPHPQPDSDGASVSFIPLLAPTDGGALAGVAGTF